MRNFERSSLNQKLTTMALVSAATALLVVFVAFAVTSVLSHRKDESMQLSSFAGVIGTNSVDALQFNDRALAGNTLAALKAKVNISRAALYDRRGVLFASYRAGQAASPGAPALEVMPAPAPVPPDAQGKARGKLHEKVQHHTGAKGSRMTAATSISTISTISADAMPWPASGVDAPLPGIDAAALDAANLQGRQFWLPRMRLYQPVTNGAGQVGVVMIEVDLSPMWLDIVSSLGVMLAAMMGSLLVSLVLATRLKRSITAPVNQLIETARQVSNSQDYSLRVAHQRNDELGTLIDSFNTMLAQIEDRGAALTHHRDELERQVGIRTAQLEKAKNAAEAASHAKSAFLATMSHEIRTPMNGVLGMTEMLLGTPLSDTQRDFTRTVKRSGEHLLVIINDILDFSKIEAGKLTVEYINFNLWDLLDDIHTVYTPQARAKQIALDFDIANDIPVAICGDPNRLRQVIANLIGNAIKFTDEGRILATVRVAGETTQSVDLRFEVHDTGIGVASDARTRIFEAFAQADDSTTRKYGGTGLGLAISKQLVELMGGAIGVDNGPQRGSVFWFTVSFDKRRVEQAQPAQQLALRGLRVLVVDEDASSRAALEAQLAGWQVVARSSSSALDGIASLRAQAAGKTPFDAAIIDMELARTSGLALAAAIKADPAIRATRLLLISPNRLAADLVQRRDAGVAYQLTKPARSADLYACLATRPRGAAPLPVIDVPALSTPSAPLAPVGRIALEPAGARPRRRARVLLAEDNPVNVEVARAMLGSLGLDVHIARHGAEALTAMRAQYFDAVLMDCQMPVMDGYAATAAIRRLERDGSAQPAGRAAGRHVPVIAITANALQGDREACIAAGMDDYLSKPFSRQDLRATLGRWIALPADAAVFDDGPAHAVSVSASAPATIQPAARAAAPRVPAGTAINERALDAIRALSAERGAALVHKVVSTWVDDTPQHLAGLHQAIAAHDTTSVRKVAHSLKSGSANVGADHFARLCRQLEQLGREQALDGAATILQDMEHEFTAVRHSLNAILEKET
jgi:two-component system sensor histidine kinase/response regulator